MAFGFGKALDVMRMGTAVRRGTWAPEFALIMVPERASSRVGPTGPLGAAIPGHVGRILDYSAALVLVDARKESIVVVPAALGSDDLLAEDWDYVR